VAGLIDILIPDGDSPLAVPVMQCLWRGGLPLRIHVMHRVAQASPPRSRFVHHAFHVPKALDPATIVQAVRTHGVQLVLPVSTAGVERIAGMAEELRGITRVPELPGLEALHRLTDKWNLHGALLAAGLPSPPTVLLTPDGALQGIEPDAPVLLKPRRGESGLGIIAVQQARAVAGRTDLPRLAEQGYIMQVRLAGGNVDRSVLASVGRVLAATTQQPLAEGKGFQPSTSLRFAHDERVTRVVDQLMAVAGWSGVAHVDTLLDVGSGLPHIVDVNPRYWATVLGSHAAGINFPDLQVRLALGRSPAMPDMTGTDFVGLAEWPMHFLRNGTPLRNSTLYYNLADLRPKLHWMLHRRSIRRAGR